MTMTSNYYRSLSPHGFHRIHYTEWGDPKNPNVLICVHGLVRTCRDFDFLASTLEEEYRVICPDIVGRGESDWLDEKTDYTYPLYINDMAMLIARINAERIDWVGTSMGGLIGIFLASYPGTPISRLLVNDIGPRIPVAGLKQVSDYVGRTVAFDTIEDVERALRCFTSTFGKLTEAQWRHIAIYSSRRLADGRYVTNYDPGIADNFRQMELKDIDLWSIWDNISCQTLVLRGVHSKVLNHKDAVIMTERGPKAKLIELPDMGHAPALTSEDQIAIVREWLLNG